MIRLAGVVNDSITDGIGLRYTIFAQGCKHNCEGCHNPQTHDVNGGYEKSIEEVFTELKKNTIIQGVTFSGGDPFLQAGEFAKLGKMIHGIGLNIWTYTGYTFEQLMELSNDENHFYDLLLQTDVLVDGRFILKQRTLELPFRGSLNQRLIDVPMSIDKGVAILRLL